ncbi:MAG TPA: LAGLIDADG family homing endonuclease [Ktedonobacteraceae bacterium]|jgi:intein-encoded DNA endonuclease-like protein
MTASAIRSSEDVSKVTTLYLEGHAIRKVAAMLNISPTIVSGIVRDAGISRDRIVATHLSRNLTVPRDWSFAPLTPEKAWVLGLIYGDGSISKQGYTITLTSGDKDIIDKVNANFGGMLGCEDRKTYWILKINSIRLWQELYSMYHLTPKKSRTITYPKTLEAVEEHFVRGLIDSDGCWYSDIRSKQPRLKFCYLSMSKNFIEDFRERLLSLVGVSINSNIQIRNVRGQDGYCIQYSNKDAIKIGEWVYRSSSALSRGDRKYEYWRRFA